ncbi:hypothetical protein [uncultured Roseibium sp.]|uniref:hypothetical protein n=1 Tax=uncultured Roseibium sp. TaxID=1936171 RepID=UPI00261864F2|nr:hypothetical protein [uncultured Roseibium sp.]
MSNLTPTRRPGEELLFACLRTPRNPERRQRLAARVHVREPRPVKKPSRFFFDPENQPRGLVGRMPETPEGTPNAVPAPDRPAGYEPTPASEGLSLDVYAVLFEICAVYGLSPIELMSGPGRYCAEARQETYYVLITACGLTGVDVGRLMRRKHPAVMAGARRHAERHQLPITWRRGRKKASGGADAGDE